MKNKFFVQINTNLEYDKLLMLLNKINENHNDINFSNLNNKSEWLMCEDITETFINNINDNKRKELFKSHFDGISTRLYSSDIVQYDKVEDIITDYEENDMKDELLFK